MLADILKCFIIGVCASVPLGPIAIFVIQKTLSKGHIAGFVTGLGATLTDTFYSAIALCALSFVQVLITKNQEYILIVGGVIVGVVGWFMMRSNPFRKYKAEGASTYSVKDFLQAALMGLSNPGAIAVIFGLFAFFGLGASVETLGWSVAFLILAVCLGSITYWYFMTLFLGHFREKIKLNVILWINRITGIIVMIIGVVLLFRGVKLILT